MENQLVLVLDFGGQYNQLIARRVRECGVYCEVIRYTTPLEEIAARKPVGIIFTGGPNSVYDEKSPHIAKEIFEMGIPILGICYGCQLMAYTLGGTVTTCTTSEYGKTETIYDKSSALFGSEELPEQAISWMSHTDYISEAPEGFTVTAHTENCPVAAMENPEKKLYAVQFHPEVNHTQYGLTMLDSFLKKVCGCTGDWTMGNYAKTAIAQIREKVGDGRVLLALSGGVDSSVCAALLSRAVGKKLTCIFVDHGFLRKNEGDEVEAAFADKDINFIRVNAKAAFMEKLNGVSDPETKRKTIGEEFIRAFERESKKLGTVDFLAQGTIYPDVIESGSGDAAVIHVQNIKADRHAVNDHHNDHDAKRDQHFKAVYKHADHNQNVFRQIYFCHNGLVVFDDFYALLKGLIKEIPHRQTDKNEDCKILLFCIKYHTKDQGVDQHETDRIQYPPQPVQVGTCHLRLQFRFCRIDRVLVVLFRVF